MGFSDRYKELRRVVLSLRKALLPSRFDPTGDYRSSERVHLRAVSFRILVHAEIESFIEDRALELLDNAWSEWRRDQVPSRVILGLIAFSGVATFAPPTRIGGCAENQKAYESMHVPLEKAQALWRKSHKDNHGVKEHNVLSLFLPLGIAPQDLDTTLLADLTSYGNDRGAVAHTSAARMAQYADPHTEWTRATLLTKELSKIDQIVSIGMQQVSNLAKANRS